MERRSWPWKKKSSDKFIVGKSVAASESVVVSLSSVASLGDQEKCKTVNYVQISLDSYTRLSGLEDQVKLLEGEETHLKGKLSAALSEINSKGNLVKQHAKVAEDAVSGWEKAEAEALLLKRQLESVTLLKLTAEDRASHLDGALKECTRQIRNVKEESEQKLHDAILAKTKHWDKIKLDLEKQLIESDQALLRAAAEKATLSKSLQERSNFIVKITDEKSQADAEIDFLKENIMSNEKEINSLKYELHVVSKELDIRNEEKNMSMRSAEAANKQHLEGVKKIVKLEAECQRLRGLVRKKLPGPAALAKMKMEVENLGPHFGEARNWSSALKNPNSHLSPVPEISNGNLQQSRKETEFLTTRLLAMEEETKMLKEALATRNSQLQASRNMCAEINCRVKSLEAQIQSLNQQMSSESNCGILNKGLSHKCTTDPPSITFIPRDSIDKRGDSAESCASVISDVSDKSIDKSVNPESEHHMELMDDFLEMERLACLPEDADGDSPISANVTDARNCNGEDKASSDAAKGGHLLSEQVPHSGPPPEQDPSDVKSFTIELESDAKNPLLFKLYSRISTILESHSREIDISEVLEEIKCAMKDILGSLFQHLVGHISEEAHIRTSSSEHSCYPNTAKTAGSQILLDQHDKFVADSKTTIQQDLTSAVSQILQFVLSLGRKAMQVPDNGHGFIRGIEDFSAYVDKLMSNEMSLVGFVLRLSHVLAKASELHFGVLGLKGCDEDVNSCDYVDKVTLLENKVGQDDMSKQSIDGCCGISHTYYTPEVLQDKVLCPDFGSDVTPCKCTWKELEELRSEKDNIAADLARCTQDLENTKLQLQEMEQLLSQGKSQLASSQKLCSLTETQLKCMTESYKSLELHAEELDSEVKLLREKTKELDNELLEEKHIHQDALARCKDLQDIAQRCKSCSICSLSSGADSGIKTKQEEREIAAAAEKLAECQETIYLLGKHLQALHPKREIGGSQYLKRLQCGESLVEDKPSDGCSKPGNDQAEIGSVASSNMHYVRAESSRYCDSSSSPADIETNLSYQSSTNASQPGHRLTKSTSSFV
ncbi:hypothetical protein Ddye_010079 [Dipteronia dyeriana]|uniref:Filament-like plant protein 4 n=1 Tax=Dipteronia dyeriana TaxID=168575 RepID=A0AAE0CMW3_9ROSI|nr:hypothetical protein Ddye_010079 [Dipteronia dyeriana]